MSDPDGVIHWSHRRDSWSGRLYLNIDRGRLILSSRRLASLAAGWFMILFIGAWLLIYAGIITQLVLHVTGVLPVQGPGPTRTIGAGTVLALAGGGLLPFALVLIFYCAYGFHRRFLVKLDLLRGEYRIQQKQWGFTTKRKNVVHTNSYWLTRAIVQETPTSDQQDWFERAMIASLGFADPIGTLIKWLNLWGNRRMDRHAEENPYTIGRVELTLVDATNRKQLLLEFGDIGLAEVFLDACGQAIDWDIDYSELNLVDLEQDIIRAET